MLFKIKYISLLLVIGVVFILFNKVYAGPYDGDYNAQFAFKMSSQSVCPKELPIDIQINIKDNIITGYIFNQGNPENGHAFCKLYHNGDITGEIDDTGKIVKLRIKQKSTHSRKYSSYTIKGSLDNDSTLISKNSQYHPRFKFRWRKEEPKQVENIKKEEVEQVEVKKVVEKKVVIKEVEIKVKEESKQEVANVKDNKSDQNNPRTQYNDTIKKVRNADEAVYELNVILRQIEMYIVIKENILTKKNPTRKERVLSIVSKEIERLKLLADSLQTNFSSKYSTPIKPENVNLYISSFKAKDIYPKIPYYIPGTSETGEMLIIPRVSDDGYLFYKLDFIDPVSQTNDLRDSMDISHEYAIDIITALNKVDEWTTVAMEKGISGRRISKRAFCFPIEPCKEKRQGNTSMEVLFQIYEDGSTSGKIQRNKGRYSVGYNFSVESAILLGGYLGYMTEIGHKEFTLGSMSDKEIEDLFE